MTPLGGLGPLKTFKFDEFPGFPGVDLDTFFLHFSYFLNDFSKDFRSARAVTCHARWEDPLENRPSAWQVSARERAVTCHAGGRISSKTASSKSLPWGAHGGRRWPTLAGARGAQRAHEGARGVRKGPNWGTG